MTILKIQKHPFFIVIFCQQMSYLLHYKFLYILFLVSLNSYLFYTLANVWLHFSMGNIIKK